MCRCLRNHTTDRGNAAGAVFSWAHDSNQPPTELQPAPDELRTILRMTATDTELIWTDAGAYPEFILGNYPPPPPGHLYSIPKRVGNVNCFGKAPTR